VRFLEYFKCLKYFKFIELVYWRDGVPESLSCLRDAVRQGSRDFAPLKMEECLPDHDEGKGGLARPRRRRGRGEMGENLPGFRWTLRRQPVRF